MAQAPPVRFVVSKSVAQQIEPVEFEPSAAGRGHKGKRIASVWCVYVRPTVCSTAAYTQTDSP